MIHGLTGHNQPRIFPVLWRNPLALPTARPVYAECCVVSFDQEATTDISNLPRIPLPTTLVDVLYTWDILSDGRILSGTNAFSGAMGLSYAGIFFQSFPPLTDAGLEEDGRELVLGPVVTGPIRIFRKIFVPTDDTFIRYLEIFENTFVFEIPFTVKTLSRVASGPSTQIIVCRANCYSRGSQNDFGANGFLELHTVEMKPRAILNGRAGENPETSQGEPCGPSRKVVDPVKIVGVER